MEQVKNNIFEYDVARANYWRQYIIEAWHKDTMFQKTLLGNIENFNYKEHIEKQRRGIDACLSLFYELDVTVRLSEAHHWYNKDITFELDSPMITKNLSYPRRDGWHKKHLKRAKESSYKKIPVLAYCWEAEDGKTLEHIGYAIPYIKDFCEWVTSDGKKHLKHISPALTTGMGNEQWWTKSKSMSIINGGKFFHKFNVNIINDIIKKSNHYQKKNQLKKVVHGQGYNGNK